MSIFLFKEMNIMKVNLDINNEEEIELSNEDRLNSIRDFLKDLEEI